VDLQRGYGVERVDTFPDAVNALTRDQVNNAIKTRLKPKKMVLVEAGSVSDSP
jgi:predicted Zn-dependent peptidase